MVAAPGAAVCRVHTATCGQQRSTTARPPHLHGDHGCQRVHALVGAATAAPVHLQQVWRRSSCATLERNSNFEFFTCSRQAEGRYATHERNHAVKLCPQQLECLQSKGYHCCQPAAQAVLVARTACGIDRTGQQQQQQHAALIALVSSSSRQAGRPPTPPCWAGRGWRPGCRPP